MMTRTLMALACLMTLTSMAPEASARRVSSQWSAWSPANNPMVTYRWRATYVNHAKRRYHYDVQIKSHYRRCMSFSWRFADHPIAPYDTRTTSRRTFKASERYKTYTILDRQRMPFIYVGKFKVAKTGDYGCR